jgi:DNA-binding response OmpR family regulator
MDSEKKKILIVEDDADVARLLSARLKSAGYEALIAVDAIQGVQFSHRQKPDLIILDLMLPAGDGLSVVENLRLSAYSSRIPIIVLTGIKDEDYKNKAMEKGVSAYFQKPYNADELLSAIKDILKA